MTVACGYNRPTCLTNPNVCLFKVFVTVNFFATARSAREVRLTKPCSSLTIETLLFLNQTEGRTDTRQHIGLGLPRASIASRSKNCKMFIKL